LPGGISIQPFFAIHTNWLRTPLVDEMPIAFPISYREDMFAPLGAVTAEAQSVEGSRWVDEEGTATARHRATHIRAVATGGLVGTGAFVFWSEWGHNDDAGMTDAVR
jgi:hypothetical protein